MALHDPEPPENTLTLELVASDLLALRRSFLSLQDAVIKMQQRELKRLGGDPALSEAVDNLLGAIQ